MKVTHDHDAALPTGSGTPSDATPLPGKPSAIVAIGASAGGLAALKLLFAHVPANSGLAFVVVVHLSPDHESHLESLLQPYIKMPVQQVTRTVPIECNRVYVIPPNANLDTVDTHLRLSELERRRRERAPIDHFFCTLAESHDGDAIGIVLTGSGSDGSLGLRRIKERGGLAIVQDPSEAEFSGMPQSAVATTQVDWVLPVARIAQAVLRFASTEPRLRRHVDTDDADAEERQFLQKVLGQTRARTGRDFGHYKRSTLLRRISRRMQFNHVEEPAAYVELLRNQPDEVHALADDLLITVTSFFRDPEVFDALETRAIPSLFQGMSSEDRVRVWCVACATGEEAYSLAILLLEEGARHPSPPAVQIFASDLHRASLDVAREGFYTEDIASQVRPDRLERFFQKESGGYRVRKQLRDVVVFAPHNVLADPPFSRVNLISCRNLLIYFERDLQEKVAELFHYALQPEGFLLLGMSETIGGTDLFLIEDKKRGLYTKRNVPVIEPRLPVFPVTRGGFPEASSQPSVRAEPIAHATLHQELLDRYGPPSALISADDNVLNFSGRAGRYFVQPGGAPTTSLFKLLRDELRVELRALLPMVREHQKAARTASLRVNLDETTGSATQVVINVWPAHDPECKDFLLLIFEEPSATDAAPLLLEPTSHGPSSRDSDAEHARELAREKRLQAIIDAYEASQEEIKASNEELQSANEELRSTLEELETSKEELQSMNEELQTVNQENRHKVDELGQLTSDLQNLLSATEIATLFLDREMRILRFTPKINELFNVRMTDRGRPLSDITHRLGYDSLHEDTSAVLQRLVPVEREVRDSAGRWYLTRILPYRSVEDRIAGTVVTFIEITRRKSAEEALRTSEHQLAEELEVMQRLHDLVTRLLICSDLPSALAEVLAAAKQISGATMGNVQLFDPESQTLEMIAQQGFDQAFVAAFQRIDAKDSTACGRVLRSGQRVVIEDVATDPAYEPYRAAAASAGYRGVQSTPLVSRDGSLLGVLSTHYPKPHTPSERDLRLLDLYARQAADYIDRRRADEALRLSQIRLGEENRHKDEYLAMLGHELRNPLAAIRGAAEILKQSDTRDPRLARASSVLERQSTHMSRIIDGLLEVSRIVRGKVELELEPLDVREVMTRVLSDRAEAIEKIGLRLDKQLPDEPCYVLGDEVRLVQVFDNLLGNALKFTAPPGSISVTIAPSGSFVSIKIRDSGVGLRPEVLSRIFQAFHQETQDVARSTGGLGLGLALARGLVELHAGTIQAASEGPGKGSEFEVRLPRSSGPAPARRKVPALQVGPQRILIVEDNVDAAEVLRDLLERRGHSVSLVPSGSTAIDLLRSTSVDVVLCDLGLPGMSGYDVARAVRADPALRHLPLIAVTGYGQKEDRARTAAVGFDGHLVKPITLSALDEMLVRLVANGSPARLNGERADASVFAAGKDD